MNSRLPRLAILLLAALSVATTPVGNDDPAPFAAAYAVKYRGFGLGVLRVELSIGQGGEYVYEHRADPVRLVRLFVSDDAVERSVMRIDGDGVRPLSWRTENGTSPPDDAGTLAFDWGKGVVRGVLKDEEFELPAEPGLQDRLSIQVAVMTSLLRGREPGTIPMVSKDRIKRYSYTRTGVERIRTPAGEFDAVRFESTRPGSTRRSHSWFAPALGYIPVRAEQWRKGKLETVMELVTVQPAAAGSPSK